MRRTERSTQTPSLSSRSRNVLTWARALTASGAQAQLLHQYIGGGSEQHAQLVGEKTRAARAVDLQPMMQFLDAIFDFTASAVNPLVQMPRGSFQVSDHKARIVFGLSVFQAYDFRLYDGAALATLPAASSIACLTKEVGCLPRRLESRRALPISRRARRFKTLFSAIPTM